jgi:hypothetical protein
VPGDKKFCSKCGKPLAESAAPQLTGNRWARRVEDFATKIEVDDVEGFFSKGLIVEAGTKAIFFVNGSISGILEPGKYDMGGLIQKIKNVFSSKSTTAVLVETGDVELHFSMSDLVTRVPIKLVAESRLVVQMDNPTLFFENMMKGRQNYPLDELKGFLEGELRNCLGEIIGGKSVGELSTSLTFKQEIEQSVAHHLARTFERKGLTFVQVRIFNFRHARMNSVTDKMEEYWLQAQDMEAQIAGEGAMMGVERRVMNLETAKALAEVEVYEERARVFERMRKAVATVEKEKLTNEDDLRKLIEDLDKGKLLRQEEIEALQRSYTEKREDHELAREHLVQKMKLEQAIEEARALYQGAASVEQTLTGIARTDELAQQEHELAMRRKALESKQAEEWAAVVAARDARRLKEETERELAKKAAQDKIEIEEMQDQADMRSAEIGISLLAKQKELKRKEEEALLERQLRAREAVSRITLQEETQRQQLKLQEAERLGNLSAEALIAMAPADRASMLLELKRTESLKGLSEEQILAMAAEKSGEVAKAFQEKFKSASAAEVQKHYDRMLAMKDQGITDLKEMSRMYSHMMQDMYTRGMEAQRDTAARAGQSGMTVITPGMGPAGVIQTGVPGGGGTAAARMIICPNCHVEVAEGVKFCDNCGRKFFE